MMMNIVRQKVIYEKVCDFKTNGYLSFPREDNNGTLYVSSQTGEIFFFSEGTSEQIYYLNNSQPSCICFDAFGGLYVAEILNGTVYYKSQSKYIYYNYSI